jgi:polysaccharide pyruvyl transferase WcaK-like protein
MTQRPIRICLILHSTRSDNLGVGALTASEVKILRDIAHETGLAIDITVMDWTSPRQPYVTGPDIRIIDINRRAMLSPLGYFAVARASDIVIDIGGGDSFADIYGSKRLIRFFVLKFLTHLAGTPLVMAPQTIGPFRKYISKRLARMSIRLCRIVATRDALSTQSARDMGVRGPIIEASDVALVLPYDPPPPRQNDGVIRVGLNVSGLLMNNGYTGRNEFGMAGDYPTLVRDIIRLFTNHPEPCEIHLVPHVAAMDEARTHIEDDCAANLLLGKEFPNVKLAPRFTSPSDAKTYIAGMDFFMGARMHACIAAFSSGVPVVPMAYSRKFEGLFGSLGYQHVVDCTTEQNVEILEKIAAAFARRSTLADETRGAMSRGTEKLERYQAALKALILQEAEKHG